MTKPSESNSSYPEPSWDYAGWDGPRRAMIERCRRLPLRQRLEEMVALIELNERFREMRARRSGEPD